MPAEISHRNVREKIRVLHVTPSIERSYGGPTQSLAGYVAASRTAGHEIHVAAPRAAQSAIAVLESAGAEAVETFLSFGSGGTASSPSMVRWVARNATRYDVVHVHGLFNFISTFAARAAIGVRAPAIIRPFGTLSRYTLSHRRSAIKRSWFRRLERPNLCSASGIHFTSETESKEAEWHGLGLADRSHVVPPPYLRAKTGNARPIDCADTTVVFVGRINRVKNIESLIDAWCLVSSSHPAAKLVIYGSGDKQYEATLRARAIAAGVDQRIRFDGFVDAAARDQALSTASLLVLPSHHENFGMAALEAIAAGVPVVVSPHVQLGDFVTRERMGIVADSSPSILASAIGRALADTTLRERVANSGMRTVEAVFNPGVIGLRLHEMYLAVLQRHAISRSERTV